MAADEKAPARRSVPDSNRPVLAPAAGSAGTDTDELRETLGDTGLAGAALACLGLVVVGRQNRRIAIGAAAVAVGARLVAYGLVGSFLESMGMGYEDL